MLDENDKAWIVEKIGALIRQGTSGIDSRTRWHSSEITDMRLAYNERLDRIEGALEKLVDANNANAQTVATLGLKIDQLVDALLHPAGNGKR